MTTTIAKTMTILCPDWCTTDERDGHDPWFTEDGALHCDHQGPEFGDHLYGNGAQVDDAVTAEIILGDVVDGPVSAAKVRELAANALAAAEWLEAQA